MENVLYSFKRENKSHHYESVLLKISFHIFISQIIDERIKQDFADALGGGDLKDACLYVPVND